MPSEQILPDYHKLYAYAIEAIKVLKALFFKSSEKVYSFFNIYSLYSTYSLHSFFSFCQIVNLSLLAGNLLNNDLKTETE
jgi:hypothetical protein